MGKIKKLAKDPVTSMFVRVSSLTKLVKLLKTELQLLQPCKLVWKLRLVFGTMSE